MMNRNTDFDRLKKGTDIEELKAEIGGSDEEVRSNQRRETTLRKLSQFRTRDPNTELEVNEDILGLCQWIEDDDSKPPYHKLYITSKRLPQPETNLKGRYYDYLMQKAITVHEIGHALYTDFDSLMEYEDRVPKEDRNLFHRWANTLEDGLIEDELRQRYRIAEELDLMRYNLSSKEASDAPRRTGSNNVGMDDDDDVMVMTMADAINAALYDMAIWNTGELSALLDENDGSVRMTHPKDEELFYDFLPSIRVYVDAYLNEANGEKRNEIAYKFYQEASDILDESEVDGRKEDHSRQPRKNSPDDMSQGSGQAQKNAGGRSSNGDVDVEEITSGTPEQIDANGDPAAVLEDSPGDEQAEGVDEDEAAEDAAEDLKGEQGGDELMDEIDEYADIIEGAEGNKELVIQQRGDLNTDTYNRSKRQGERIESVLGDSLRMTKRDQTVRRKTRGSFDDSRMIPAARGQPNVMKATRRGEEKDYNVVFVKDSSGSTSSDRNNFEYALGSLMLGMEPLGIDTSLLDVEDGVIKLSKPFGADVESHKQRIFNGRAKGGTPLRHALWFARQRVDTGGNNYPFVVVLCDGKPSDIEKYKEELQRCSFPVVGVYVDTSAPSRQAIKEKFGGQLDIFHRYAVVADADNLERQLYHLCADILL